MSSRAKILIGAATTLVILVVVVVLHHFHVKGAAARYRAELVAQGEPLTWQEILPPPLKSDENSATLFLSLVARLPQIGVLATNQPARMEMIVPGKAMAGWAMPWVGAPDFKDFSNSWEEAIGDYRTQEALLREFHALIDRPSMDFHLDFSQGANLALMHLLALKRTTLRLCAATACELSQESAATALSHLRAALALASERPQEPVLITELVRIAIAAIAAEATWDYLQSPGLDDADLARLQDGWSQLTFFGPMQRAFEGERCLMLQSLAEMRESSAGFARLTRGVVTPIAGGAAGTPPSGLVEKGLELAKEGWDRTKFSVAEGAWRVSWSHTDELRMLRGQQALIEVARQAAKDAHASNAIRLTAEFHESGQIPESSEHDLWVGGVSFVTLQTMFSDSAAAGDKAFTKALRGEVNARLVTTAIALERYRLSHGVYPHELNALVPEFLDAIPRDPADGVPLRYKPTEGGFLLYSIGEDLVDDDGNPSKPDGEAAGTSFWWGYGRDWVWAQRATPDEVQAFWERELDRGHRHLPAEREIVISNLARAWTQSCFQALTNSEPMVHGREP